MLLIILFWTIVYCLCNAFSIVLLGDRSLISGNLLEWSAILKLLFNWKFILAMTLAVFARVSYVFLNNSFLKVPRLAGISTTLTTFVTLISLLFIVIANYYFLDEKLNMQQMAGAAIILLGVGIMMK
jgi:drug/metabolite transporter (DMT)-like permease